MGLRSLISTALFLSISLLGQSQLFDDFSDGDFSVNPTWTGNAGVFIVNADEELQLNDVIASSAYLQTDNVMASLDDQEWRIWVKQSFSPSGSNFGRVYLVSDQSDLSGNLNGYYLQFGEAGSDDAVELFEQSGGTSTSVCRATDGQISSSFEVGIRVVRESTGLWNLYADYTGGTNYTLEATGTNTTHSTSAHFGVSCTYTVSNSDNFYYDDVYAGPIIVDTDPPVVNSATAINDMLVDVVFNEPVDAITAGTNTNYTIDNGIMNPASVTTDADPTLVHLNLGIPLVNGQNYVLTVTNVEDVVSNAMTSQDIPFTYFVPAAPQFREVVINEIMCDPSPVVGLPETEFVELYNNSNQIFDLAQWEFSDGTTDAELPSYVLNPNEYVVIIDEDDTASFWFITNKVVVPNFPSLNNTGDELFLFSNNGDMIDRVNYTDDWYQDENKDDGGWTLEQINNMAPCTGQSNWRASEAANGGTPGTENSVIDNTPDTEAPELVTILVQNDTQIELVFNETLDSNSVLTANYNSTPSIGIGTINNVPLDYERVIIDLSSAMDPGTIYTLTVTDVNDCSGNPIGSANTGQFALPGVADPGDVVINELLSDPRETGADFIELYNRSMKVISLQNWQFSNEDETGVPDDEKIITDQSVLLFPGEHLALTEDKANILAEYPMGVADRILQIDDLPSYSNDEGVVILFDNSIPATQIDRVPYDDDMHFALLNSTDGVSLERIDPERSSTDRTNWHSAAETVGWATPGYQNSQFSPTGIASSAISLDPEVFSPDNDGYQDLVDIKYKFDQAGFTANITIFDSKGRQIRRLVKNELLGTSGTFSWDGLTDDRQKARIGAYVIFTEVFDLSGNVKQFKNTCVLAHQLK